MLCKLVLRYGTFCWTHCGCILFNFIRLLDLTLLLEPSNVSYLLPFRRLSAVKDPGLCRCRRGFPPGNSPKTYYRIKNRLIITISIVTNVKGEALCLKERSVALFRYPSSGVQWLEVKKNVIKKCRGCNS